MSIDPKNAREASNVDEDEIEEEHPVGGGGEPILPAPVDNE